MFNQSIVFEQPVNELIRVCLRIEHLWQFTQKGMRGEHRFDSHNTLAAIIDILSITDRPDLRGKFTKEFMRQSANLQRFLNEDHIDQQKLKATLGEFETIIHILQNASGKFSSTLRDNEFITSIRQHLTTPGGSCSFDTPAYHYWLQQPVKERQMQIAQWLEALEELLHVIQFMLQMARQSGQPKLHTAHGGFYQESLDPQTPSQLIRVAVPNTIAVFPEISVGRHGVSIRFYYPTTKERAVPYEKDVQFRLSCCIL
jgi:cell division protein ZapD